MTLHSTCRLGLGFGPPGLDDSADSILPLMTELPATSVWIAPSHSGMPSETPGSPAPAVDSGATSGSSSFGGSVSSVSSSAAMPSALATERRPRRSAETER